MVEGSVKKVVIIGATSGIGRRLAEMYLAKGHLVGVTGRRTEELKKVVEGYADRAFYRTMDVTDPACVGLLDELIDEMGGMDLMIYSSGVGSQNPALVPGIEMEGVEVNVDGFTRIAVHSYNYFKEQCWGQLVVISSVAGVRSLRHSPSYSATKRFQIHYMSCLAQKANYDRVPIVFTTIIPGFIRTEMLKHKYPFTTSLEKGASKIFHAIELKRRQATIPGRWYFIKLILKLIPNFLWEKI